MLLIVCCLFAGIGAQQAPWKPFSRYSIAANRATKANVGTQWDTTLLSADSVAPGNSNATTWAVTLDSIKYGQVFIGVAPADTSQSAPDAMNNGWFLDTANVSLAINGTFAGGSSRRRQSHCRFRWRCAPQSGCNWVRSSTAPGACLSSSMASA
eukprot:TRINITY_DN4076_c0_g1_i1.p2 TRINITY_DN4076_c0_g1~~TRINITY_DN4076_c0_g1_i1.p2  ORF type:complete len:154 (-),score=5.34 TRINITY_DN4076_c0_g1_i1:84-545(-)